jgi:hypothetical protein
MKLKMRITAVIDESSIKIPGDILELLRSEAGVEVCEFGLTDIDEAQPPVSSQSLRKPNPRPWIKDSRAVLKPGPAMLLDIDRTLEKMGASKATIMANAYRRGTLESAVKKAISRTR